MRKLIVAAIVGGLVAGSLVAPAAAKKRKPAPAPVTFFLHGPYAAGEIDHVEGAANAVQGLPDGFQVMDATEPTDPAPDSMGLTNYVAGANRNCSGNSLFPTWQGAVTGRITGDMKLYLHSVSPAARVLVEVFPDSVAGCDSKLGTAEYVEPVASVEATLAAGPGENEIVIEDVDFKTLQQFVIMVSPAETVVGSETVLDPASQGRVLYDAAAYASRLEFLCTPTIAKSCLPAP